MHLNAVVPLAVVSVGSYLCGPSVTLAAALLYVVYDFVCLWDTSIPVRQQIPRYFKFRKNFLRGWWNAGKFAEQTTNVKQTQDAVLRHILETNADTAYARDFHLDNVRTREEYVKVHPVTKYAHFKDYCLRAADGEKKVMSVEDPLFFGLTSGTTGEPSKIPIIQANVNQYENQYLPLLMYHLGSTAPRVDKLNRRMGLFYNPKKLMLKTTGGIPMGAASGFILGQDPLTTPKGGFEIKHEPSCRYVHLLFGLHKRDLTSIEGVFVSVVYMAFHDLELQWPKLVEDIRIGTLNKDLQMEADERRLLERKLSPDPARAVELEIEFKKGFRGIATRIWPKLELIMCATSGSFGHYTDMVRDKYLGDNGKEVKMFGPVYGCTEGLLGMNFWPDILPSRYLIIPTTIFLEFIPYDHIGEDSPQTVFLEQIEKDHDYEIVLTTAPGLRRYRMGDVVRVVEFYNKCPVVQLLHRTTQLLSIKGEKTSEIAVQSALAATLSSVSLRMEDTIVDFASCESVFLEALDQDDKSVKSPYYAVFLEVAEKSNSVPLRTAAFAQTFDGHLCEHQGRYKYQREKGGLDPLHIIFVKAGAFAELRYFMLATTTASPVQLKLPKILRKQELVEFMLTQRIERVK